MGAEDLVTHTVETSATGKAVAEAMPGIDDLPLARPVTPSLGMPCPACGDSAPYAATSYVYALGRILPRFPSLSVEKEFAQAIGRADAVGLTDGQALHKVLSKRENRYLARQLCYVLTIQGVETYILRPRDPADLDLLINATRSEPRATDVDVVIGSRGPLAPPELCNGLMIPLVLFDQIYSFDINSLINSIPKPKEVNQKQFPAMAEAVFMRIMQMADNAGASDEHRAMNYLAIRYPAIYASAAELLGGNSSLTSVDVRPSPLGGVRRIMDVVFTYTNRQTDVTEKNFVRVDVSDEFPFLISKVSPYLAI